MPHCWWAFSGIKSMGMCLLFYVPELFTQCPELCLDLSNSQTHCTICICSLSPVISLRTEPSLSISVFPNWGRGSMQPLINVGWIMNDLETYIPSLMERQFLQEAGSSDTKDTPPSRFNSERTDFPGCHHLRDLCFLVICNANVLFLLVALRTLLWSPYFLPSQPPVPNDI